MDVARNLSKSRFQKGLQCEKALWLSVNQPEAGQAVTEAQQWIFDQGHEVGMLARELFPGGIEVAEDHFHSAEALETTARLLAEGTRILYEPAFEFGGAFARVDILAASDEGGWDLYEVKSGTALKDVYVTDAAVQAYVLEGAGLRLRTVNVVRIDTSYVYAGGPYDVNALFAVEDVTELVRAYLPSVGLTISRLRTMLDGPEPEVLLGSWCSHPYTCEFGPYCRSFLPGEYPITDLPRLSEPVMHALLKAGHTSLLEVPGDFPGLTAAQREAVAAAKAGEPRVDFEGLSRALGALAWPVYHLDFETVAPALPIWPGTRPYQQVPFQYSVHVHYADGTIKHRHYLHRGDTDPRRRLARHLIADCGRRGSVMHYTSYERTQIDNLMAALPDLAPTLGFIRKRLVDLAAIVRTNMRHPRAAGRSSIKYVLPAWCPDLSYSAIKISDGQTASSRYLRILKGEVDEAEAQVILSDLKEYCGLDTYGMARLLSEMIGLLESGKEP